MTYDLQAIENSRDSNAGGLCSFDFVPIEWVDVDCRRDLYTGKASNEIELIPGVAWLKAHCLQASMGFSEVLKDGSAGVMYEQNIIGVLNGDSPLNNALMNAMPLYEYVVIYYGQNNEKKIIGSKTKGMRFVADFKTDVSYDGKHSFSINLNLQSTERAMHYPYGPSATGSAGSIAAMGPYGPYGTVGPTGPQGPQGPAGTGGGGGGASWTDVTVTDADFVAADDTRYYLPANVLSANRSVDMSAITTRCMFVIAEDADVHYLSFAGATVYAQGGTTAFTQIPGLGITLIEKIATHLIQTA